MLKKKSILNVLITFNIIFYLFTLILSYFLYTFSIQKSIEEESQKYFQVASDLFTEIIKKKVENNKIIIKMLSLLNEKNLDYIIHINLLTNLKFDAIYIFKDDILYYSQKVKNYDKIVEDIKKVNPMFTTFILIENHLHTVSMEKNKNISYIIIDHVNEIDKLNNTSFLMSLDTNNKNFIYRLIKLSTYFKFNCYIGIEKQNFLSPRYSITPFVCLLLNICISVFYLVYDYKYVISPLIKLRKFVNNVTPGTSYILFPDRYDEIGILSYKLHNLLVSIYESSKKEKLYLTELSDKTDRIKELNKLMSVIEKDTKILTYLVENIDIGLCVIEGKIIIYCNEVFLNLLQVNCNKNNVDFILKKLNPYLKYLIELNKDGDLICFINNKNISVSFKILSNNIIISTQDITEISTLQKNLNDVNSFYTASFNYSPTPTIIIDADKVIKNVNVAFLDVFKLYTVDNLVYNLSVYIPDFDLSSKVTSTTTCKTLDNVEFKSEIICIKIKNTDLFILFLSKINSDNEKLYNLNIQLEEKSRKLEESYNELEKYTHIIAHDLKARLRGIFNSLDIVRTNLDLYIKTNNFDNFNKFITLAYQSSVRLNILITRLSELNKYMKCQIDTIIEPSLIINSVIQDLNFDISAKKATITVQSNIPRIKSSELLFRQVIQNLIVNSMKFCKELPIINITFNTTANSIIINISDNGIGIKSNQDIFIIFKRLNNNIEGDGVGLSIVKKIMEKHNGKIWYEDNKPFGVIFHLEFNKIGE